MSMGVLWRGLAAALALFGAAGAQAPGTLRISSERFGSANSPRLLILLHGASGPGRFLREQAGFFARRGFHVILPHYLEAGRGVAPTEENYRAWVAAVRGAMADAGASGHTVLFGYSLGASIALALGSEGHGPDAVAELAGSLPDYALRDLQGMPPLLILHGGRDIEVPVNNALQLARLCTEAELLCEQHIYPNEGHVLTPDALRDADERVLRFFARALPGGASAPLQH